MTGHPGQHGGQQTAQHGGQGQESQSDGCDENEGGDEQEGSTRVIYPWMKKIHVAGAGEWIKSEYTENPGLGGNGKGWAGCGWAISLNLLVYMVCLGV